MADDDTPDGGTAAKPDPNAARRPSATPAWQESRASESEWTISDTRGPLETAGADKPSDAPAYAGANPVETGDVPVAGEPVLRHETDETAPSGEPAAPLPEADVVGSSSSEPAGSLGPVQTVADSQTRSVWPIVAGLVVGAIIGAGSAAVVDVTYGGSSAGDTQAASLAARVDALEKRPDPAALTASLADLDRKVAALQGGAKTASSADPASGPSSQVPASTSGPDLAPLQRQVAALQVQVEALKGQGSAASGFDTKIAALETTIAGMKKDTSSAQAGVESVEGQQKTIATQQKLLADKVMVPALAVVADSLVQQIDAGEPFATQVAALETLGADPAKIAVLKENADRGVLSAKALAARFAPLAEPISAIAHKAPANAGFMDRLKSGMFSMVSVRTVDDTGGTDLPSRVARIKADLAHDDVADALSTWNALPEDAKAKGQDWSLLAKAHAEAMGAARALQHDAIVALGAKKS